MKKNNSIKLSKEHGVNPSILVCPICGEDGSIALLGRLKGTDEKAPMHMTDRTPCDKCINDLKEYEKKGFVLIVVKDEFPEPNGNTVQENFWPYFDRLFVLSEQGVRNLFPPDFDTSAGKAVLSNSTANEMGLTKEQAQ